MTLMRSQKERLQHLQQVEEQREMANEESVVRQHAAAI